MIRLFLLLPLAVLSTQLSAQINWVYDLKTAQVHALSKNQLIVIDFWAHWCGPCRIMDQEMWNHPDMQPLAENFVALRIDVDSDPGVARKYRATAIPKVVVADASGEIIWEMVGFGDAIDYLSVLQALPDEVSHLNKILRTILQKQEDSNTYYQLGLAYQKFGRETSNPSLKNAFLALSDQHFRQVSKKSNDEVLTHKAALYSILNDAYRRKPKQVMKQMARRKETYTDEALSELSHFIMAYCYKCEGDEENLRKEKKQLSNQEYLKQLEE